MHPGIGGSIKQEDARAVEVFDKKCRDVWMERSR